MFEKSDEIRDDRPKNLQTLLAEGYTVKIGEYLSLGWEILQSKLGLFLGFAAVYFAILLVLGTVEGLIAGTVAAASDNPPRASGFVANLISAPLDAGFIIAALLLIKKQPVSFSDFFKGFQYFVNLFLARVVGGILTIVGLILCVVPGVYLAVSYMFAPYLIVDRRFGFWEALENSRKIVSKEWLSWFGFVVVLVLINLAGALVCGIGLLVTIPLSFCATSAAYEDVMGIERSSY